MKKRLINGDVIGISADDIFYYHFLLVEMAGIEPASENPFIQVSPSAVSLLKFPHQIADRQAKRLGSPRYGLVLRGAQTDRSPLIDALSAAVVLHGKTAA